MFSRIYWARFRPEESDNVVRVARESVPVHQRSPGFQRITYLYDRDSGLGVAIEVFETEEQAESGRDHVKSVIDAFAEYVAEQPSGTRPLLEQNTALPILEVIAEG